MNAGQHFDSSQFRPRTTRRQFLEQTAGLAAGAGLLGQIGTADGEPGSAAAERLPTIKIGPYEVTRLIIGGNPIYGYSHFNHLFSEHQRAWHTPERVVELMKHCEGQGLNTWQFSYSERTLADLARYRAAGGVMQWLCLGEPNWDQHPERIDDAAKRKPIGIAPHGALGERLYRENKLTALTDLLKRIRDVGGPHGCLVGLSAHNPALMELADEKGWDVDYYMCCLYYLTRPREEFRKILGAELPLGEIYLPSDPPRMFRVVQHTRKPCLAYKVLAAGRRIDSAAERRRCFETAFSSIKPSDGLIVGMYQQFTDQVAENAAVVRELCGARR
ncbi:MAG TPA: hypothetical protein VG146_08080 [Verrucomicrobiae bacterium]|nr:hypothetical protein [Verrucomicrobiae bacterium]